LAFEKAVERYAVLLFLSTKSRQPDRQGVPPKTAVLGKAPFYTNYTKVAVPKLKFWNSNLEFIRKNGLA
jgi:hypothetical protein